MTSINYNIKTVEARIRRVNKILEENEDSIQRYFDNVFLNKATKIPYHYLLNQLSNYILYDKPSSPYKKEMQDKFENSALGLHGDGEPYYLKDKITIEEKDLDIPEIKEKQDLINALKTQKKWAKEAKYDQILIKESKLPPLRAHSICCVPQYEQIFEFEEEDQQSYYCQENEDVDIFEIDTTNNPLNLDLFDEDNWNKIILRVLPYQNQVGSRVDKLVTIFNKVYPLCEFRKVERDIIRIFQESKKKDYGYEIVKNIDVSKKLGIDQNAVSRNIQSICKKLCDAYEELFTDYYYTFLVKGTYKKCSKCGENKIIQKYHKNSNSADGRKSICTDCLKAMYKVCNICEENLNIDEFALDKNTKDGHKSYCKTCDANRKK